MARTTLVILLFPLVVSGLGSCFLPSAGPIFGLAQGSQAPSHNCSRAIAHVSERDANYSQSNLRGHFRSVGTPQQVASGVAGSSAVNYSTPYREWHGGSSSLMVLQVVQKMVQVQCLLLPPMRLIDARRLSLPRHLLRGMLVPCSKTVHSGIGNALRVGLVARVSRQIPREHNSCPSGKGKSNAKTAITPQPASAAPSGEGGAKARLAEVLQALSLRKDHLLEDIKIRPKS